jgi:hypothetical protein
MVMVLLMSMIVTVRTGRCDQLSTARLTRMAATGLAQNYPSPQIAGELTHFLRERHWLIKVGQEVTV